jgi:hypothetical protein
VTLSIRKLLVVAAVGLSLAWAGTAAAADLDINPMPPTFAPFWQAVPNSPGVEFAANLPTDVFRYQDNYYFYWKKKLYQSNKPSGPWKSVAQEPDWFKGIDKGYFKMLEDKPPAPPFGGARPLPPQPKPPAAGKPGAAPPKAPPPAASPPAMRPPPPSATIRRPPVAPPGPTTPAAPPPVARPLSPPPAPTAPQATVPKPAPPAAALSAPTAPPAPSPAPKKAPAADPKLPKAM